MTEKERAEESKAGGEGSGGKTEEQPVISRELERILSIEIPVIALIAEKTMKLKEVLNLTVGSIIELEKPAEEPLDLMVNDQRIGRGETVRTGENFGLHILELGPVRETIRKLGKAGEGAGKPAEGAAPAEGDQPSAT